jgi:hypothetical protein
MKITKSQLKQIIKEEASRFVHIQTLKERREEIIKELNLLNESDELLEEGLKGWITAGLLSLAAIGGGAKVYQLEKEHAKNEKIEQKYYNDFLSEALQKMSKSELEDLGIDINGKTNYLYVSGNDSQEELQSIFSNYARNYIMSNPKEFGLDSSTGKIKWLNQDNYTIKENEQMPSGFVHIQTLKERREQIIRKINLLNEEEVGNKSLLEQIKDLLKANKFLADKADFITEEMVKDEGNSIYLQFPNELDSPHIKKHFDKSGPASAWSISKESVSDLILKTIKTKPTKSVQEGPTFKYKWLNVNSGKNIGFDSLKKVSEKVEQVVDLEPFGMVDRVKDWNQISKVVSDNNYELVTKNEQPYTEEDLNNNEPAFIKQNIGVIYGDKTENPTSIFNLILAKIGEVNNKPVLTLMTVFPGINPVDNSGNDITNKKDLIKHGYALIKSKSINESIRKIVREGFLNLLKENIYDNIENISDKHCGGEFNWWNLMEDIKLALKGHFENYSITELPDTDDSCGFKITKDDRSVPLYIKYDDDRGENIIKIICKDSNGTYEYEMLSWENTGGESRGFDSFGHESSSYQEEGVECDVKKSNIQEAITEIEEYLNKKYDSIK